MPPEWLFFCQPFGLNVSGAKGKGAAVAGDPSILPTLMSYDRKGSIIDGDVERARIDPVAGRRSDGDRATEVEIIARQLRWLGLYL